MSTAELFLNTGLWNSEGELWVAKTTERKVAAA